MKKYEAMIILDPSLEEDPREEIIKEIQELIKKNNGQFLDINIWGKRKLAYPIKKFEDGFYIILTFNGQNETIIELNRVMKIRDNIIRFMITKAA